MRLDRAAAVVTGGASGLGRATAGALIARGAQVVIADLAGSQGSAVAEGLGQRCRFVAADVTDEADVATAVDTAAAMGDLRVAVNCAGVATPGRVLSSKTGPLPLETFRTVVEVNLVGTFNVVRLAAEAMAGLDAVDEERGVIVNTASVAAFEGQVGQVAYAASKGGVAAMTLSVARDLATSAIRCVTVAPGLFATSMLAGLPQQAQDSLADQVVHPPRLGHAEEYAAFVCHIVDNPMLNGAVIRLDGAVRMPAR